ncbi:MAG: RsmE family RNA methyltransferase [Verrucomicrobia bacterium]|jgi:RsmE family RNA methyltransferase|nr:RsmE family RNA methyltransferase [Verrucomicrobiota bacterium]
MNRILFEERRADYRLPASDPRFTHARGVLCLRKGDVFDVGLVNGPVGKATVTAVDRRQLSFAVEWGEVPPPPPEVHLLLGLCRPATARKILGTVPTLGARSLTFFVTERTDPAYAKASLWIDAGWRKPLREGVEQAFDTWMPEVNLRPSLEEAFLHLPQKGLRFALDIYEAEQPLGQALGNASPPLFLALGPERGWSRSDRQRLRGAGFAFVFVDLPTRILRLETAVTAALTLVHQQRGDRWTPPPRP